MTEASEGVPNADVMATKRSMFDLSDDEDDNFLAAAAEASSVDKLQRDDKEAVGMTTEQAARAEKNRLKAVALKKARLAAKDIKVPDHITGEKATAAGQGAKKPVEVVDTGAGFFIEEDDVGEMTQAVEKPAPIIEPDR